MLPPGTCSISAIIRSRFLAIPNSLDDRYLARVQADPGGPGIEGDFPHQHPSLIETFTCISGSMTASVGRTTREVAVGETVAVSEGRVHGFVNTGRVR